MRFGPGSFLGELNLLTGQAVYLIARVVENGDVRRGSMKRVAAAVGEGVSAIRSVHTTIGIRAHQ